MEQHIKTDLKIMVKEAGKDSLTSVNVPANVGQETTEAQALKLADILKPIFPLDAAISRVQRTGQLHYIPNAPVE